MKFRRSVIITELWWSVVARRWKSFISLRGFWKNDPLWENFQNSVPNGFVATPLDMLCSNFMKFGWWEIGIKLCVIYLTKNFAWLNSSHYCTDRAQNLPDNVLRVQCSRFHPNWFTFDTVISERLNTIRVRSKMNPVFGGSLASSRIMNEFWQVFKSCKN